MGTCPHVPAVESRPSLRAPEVGRRALRQCHPQKHAQRGDVAKSFARRPELATTEAREPLRRPGPCLAVSPGGAERIPFGTAKLVTRLGRPSAGAGRKGLGPALSRLPSKGGCPCPAQQPQEDSAGRPRGSPDDPGGEQRSGNAELMKRGSSGQHQRHADGVTERSRPRAGPSGPPAGLVCDSWPGHQGLASLR